MSRARLGECLDLAQSLEQDSGNYRILRELISSLKAELAEHDSIGNHVPAMHAEWAAGPHRASEIFVEAAA
jgi:hypothetical protein